MKWCNNFRQGIKKQFSPPSLIDCIKTEKLMCIAVHHMITSWKQHPARFWKSHFTINAIWMLASLQGNVFDFSYWWFQTAALVKLTPYEWNIYSLCVIILGHSTARQKADITFLGEVLQSPRFCLFSPFTFCHLSLLCVVHRNIGICLSLSHTHTLNHAHMSTHAFTDKTFSWRVNTREKRKMTCSNHTEALPVITLCCHWWRRNQRAGSSFTSPPSMPAVALH